MDMLSLLVFLRSRALFGVLVCFSSKSSKWLSSNGCRCQPTIRRHQGVESKGGGLGLENRKRLIKKIRFLAVEKCAQTAVVQDNRLH